METKRCPYCHKLQRADAQVCSRCGHTFLSKRPGARNPDASRPSIPPASPHRAGHYSGLHPEDQPYQSSKMAILRPVPAQDDRWRRPLHEPERIVLPSRDVEETFPVATRHVADKVAQPVFPSQDQAKPSFSFTIQPVSVLLALACLFFLLASCIIAFAMLGKDSSIDSAAIAASPNAVHINDTFTLSGRGFTSHHWLTFTYDSRHPILDDNQRPLGAQVGEDGRFSVEIRVPATWRAGQHSIYALDDAQKFSISTSITVQPTTARQSG
jgi:hypothetical protein